MELKYQITSEAAKRIFVETGTNPGTNHNVTLDPTTLTPEERKLLLEINPRIDPACALTLPRWGLLGPEQWPLTLDRIADSPADLWGAFVDAWSVATLDYVAGREAAIEKTISMYQGWDDTRPPQQFDAARYAGSPRLDDLKAARAHAMARAEALAAAVTAQREREAAAKREAAQQREAERAEWITAHGSDYLRKCLAGGYDCQRAYVIERAGVEHPGYTVDYLDAADWKDRSGPSEAALDEAARVGGTVVWLTVPVIPSREDEGEFFDPCEAVVIRQYLGKYDLIKIM